MARTLASLIVFVCVSLLAGLISLWGLQSTGISLAKIIADAPVKTEARVGYVSTLRMTGPAALNVATVIRVAPVGPIEKADKTSPQASAVFTHTVSVEALRVRSGPNKVAPQVFALKGGTKVRVVKEDRGWVMIDAGEGRIGWAYHKFLRPAAIGDPPQADL